MSSTARTVVTDALKLIQVTHPGRAPSADEMTDGVRAINLMLHSLEAEGVKLGFADIGVDDDVPLADRFIRGVKYLLAIDLAPEYGVEVAPEVAIIAAQSKTFLQTAFTEIPRLEMDTGLRNRRWSTTGEQFDGT